MTKFINLTPHAINLVGRDPIAPSGIIARCAETVARVGEIDGVTVMRREYGAVTDLPAAESGTVYIASLLVAQRANRADVLTVGDAVRDDAGRIVGCKSLSAVASESPDIDDRCVFCGHVGPASTFVAPGAPYNSACPACGAS